MPGDYAEALVRLPGSYQVNDRQRPIAEAPPRAALGLAGRRRRALQLQRDLEAAGPMCSMPGRRSCAACPAPCCGCLPAATAILPWPTCDASWLHAASIRARLVFATARPERRIPRALRARRPVPRQLAVQRAHDRQRRAVGRLPGAHAGRATRSRAGLARAFRSPSGCPSSSPRRRRLHQAAVASLRILTRVRVCVITLRGAGARVRLFDTDARRRARSNPPTSPWPTSTGAA